MTRIDELLKSEDPLLQGQIAQVLGAIEGLMTVIGAPPPQRTANVGKDSGDPHGR